MRLASPALLAAVFAFAILATAPARAFADDCSEFRLDGPGGSMEHVKVRDQEGLGICFAETGAQVADAIRFSRLGDRNYALQTSGAAAAVGVSNVLGYDALHRGGGSCWSLKYINKYGICDQSAVEDAGPEGLAALRSATLAGNLADNSRLATSTPRDAGRCTPGGTPFPAALEMSEALHARVAALTSDLRPAITGVGAACARRSPRAASNPFERVDLSCEPFPTARREGGAPTAAEYKSKIAESLKPGGLPLEIHYCAEFLDGGGARTSRGPGAEGGCAPHASLIIGRRRAAGGKCQYLVRNSWGTECDHYSAALRPDCEEGKGNIWIDADTMAGRTLGVVPPPQISPRRL